LLWLKHIHPHHTWHFFPWPLYRFHYPVNCTHHEVSPYVKSWTSW
jgi:hypothetical protein